MGAARGLTGTVREPHQTALAHAPLHGVARVDLQHVLFVPDEICGAPRLRAGVVLAENAPVVSNSGKSDPVRSSAGRCSVTMK